MTEEQVQTENIPNINNVEAKNDNQRLMSIILHSRTFQGIALVGVGGFCFAGGIIWQARRALKKEFKKKKMSPEIASLIRQEARRAIIGGTIITIAYGFLGYYIITRFNSVSKLENCNNFTLNLLLILIG